MFFMIKGRDGEDTRQTRKTHLKEHLDYVEANMSLVRVAGPLVSDDGRSLVGSLYIIEVADEPAAKRFIENDPYYHTGIWAELEVTPFRSVAGEWVGGRTW